MNPKDPFEFDISVSAAKNRSDVWGIGLQNKPDRSESICQHDGCSNIGEFKAPIDPEHENPIKWLCRKHIKLHNKNWTYSPKGKLGGTETENIHNNVAEQDENTGDYGSFRLRSCKMLSRRLTYVERKALSILNLNHDCSLEDVRREYRSLVKDLHPDNNRGDRSDEDRLKTVVWAWNQIRESKNFIKR